MEKVSVIIPVWDKPELLFSSIGSVLTQTHQNFEILIIGDGCPEKVWRQYVKVVEMLDDKRITQINLDKHIDRDRATAGIEPRNLGLQRATGAMIAPLDDDDIWMPTHLERSIDILNDTKSDMVYGKSLCASFNVRNQPTVLGRGIEKGFTKASIAHSSVVYRAHLKENKYEIPPHSRSSDHHNSADRWLWLRLFEAGAKIRFDPSIHCLLYYGRRDFMKRLDKCQQK